VNSETSSSAVTETLHVLRSKVQNLGAEELVTWAWRTFGSRVALASSLGLEDQVLTDMLSRLAPGMTIFTLDTGRLFPETYELLQRTREHYGLDMRVYFPDARDVEELVSSFGPNLFRESVALRKRCCFARKVLPLRRALAGLAVWICGLRKEQSSTREDIQTVEWDEGNWLVKLNPLAAWTEAEVWTYIREHGVPYNALHDKGFPSIGCACCTRATWPGEDYRAGRWWWEVPEKKECGLHWRDGKLLRPALSPQPTQGAQTTER